MTDLLNVDRIPGKTGISKITLHDELILDRHGVTVPDTLPTEWDQTRGVTNQVGMLGNNEEGDCVTAAWQHGRMFKGLLTFVRGLMHFVAGFVKPTTANTLALYWRYGIAMGEPAPRPDQGSDPGSFFQYLYKNGFVKAYAQVAWEPIATVGLTALKAAAVQFNGVLLCISCPPQMQAQFFRGETLSVSATNQPNPAEGHGIWLCGYNDTTKLFKIVTWGNVVYCTYEFVIACLTGAFVDLSQEDFERAGGNWASLLAAIEALPGASEPDAPSTGVNEHEELEATSADAENWLSGIEEEVKRICARVEAFATNATLDHDIDKAIQIAGLLGEAVQVVSEVTRV